MVFFFWAHQLILQAGTLKKKKKKLIPPRNQITKRWCFFKTFDEETKVRNSALFFQLAIRFEKKCEFPDSNGSCIAKRKLKPNTRWLPHPHSDTEVQETVSDLKQESDPQSKTTKRTFRLFPGKIKIMERFIENLPPMDLMRFEKMTFVQLIIPVESAHWAVSYLDELGLLQFHDVSFCWLRSDFVFLLIFFFIRFLVLAAFFVFVAEEIKNGNEMEV